MLGHEGYLNWSDRKLLVPTRIGSFSGYELSLRKGSVLNRLSDEKIDVSSELVRVARSSRKSFGTEINEKVEDIRNKVVSVAGELGVNVGEDIFAMLDAESVSINGGAISLHDQDGVPLRNMGTGSSRLLVAGLQKEAALKTSIVLVDELEYGLEPHRILRFLGSLGVKDKTPSMQSFMTTHSPVAVRELADEQLFRVRNGDGQHSVISFENDDVQGTLRLFPDAFLASSVLVCEGATEIGFLRGFDSFLVSKGRKSLFARGIALVDGGGSSMHQRANAFAKKGYRTAIFRDDDVKIDIEQEDEFLENAGSVFSCSKGKSIEDHIFAELNEQDVLLLVQKAISFKGRELIDAQLGTATKGILSSDKLTIENVEGYRSELAKAAKSKNSWFKSISEMEEVSFEIVFPKLKELGEFKEIVTSIFNWIKK